MKKFLLLFLFMVLGVSAPKAQSAGYDEFPITVSGGMTSYTLMSQYYWDSPNYVLTKSVDGVRLTFLSNNTGEQFNGYPAVAIAELTFYDRNYNIIQYSAEQVTVNSAESGEGSLGALNDNDYYSYYTSAYRKASVTPNSYVYIDVKFEQPVSMFFITMVSRSLSMAPASMVISESGVSYNGTVDNGGSGNGGNGGSGNGDDTSVVIPTPDDKEECLYVYLSNGGVDSYAVASLDGEPYVENDSLCISLLEGGIMKYDAQQYDSCSAVVPELPVFKTFKFNNKYNGNLHIDAEADTITPELNFTLNAIGKWLTPSFTLSDKSGVVYLNGVLQNSKESRCSFAQPQTYVVTYPGYNRIAYMKVQDEVWEYGEETTEQVALTADMLSTNKPSTDSSEGLGNLLDNRSNTIFHSTWGSANNSTVNVNCYIEIELPEALDRIRFYYMTRPATGYNPLELQIYVSNDRESWTLARTLTTEDGMPTRGISQEYTSPTIELPGSYRYVRILQSKGEYSKNHMALAELRVYKVTPQGDPVKVQDAQWQAVRVPFGRNYKVSVNWLADKTADVPRIDISVEGGYTQIHYNKDTYYNATISIIGNGMYDYFYENVKIKGRGNSTWSYPKKPYRLKFNEKRKPFGLTNGKSWVLLANYQDGSFLSNPIAFKIGQLVGAQYTNHAVPVDLYMDGKYVGSYVFTEKVGFANNSVDIDEDLGVSVMLELDEYYDETYKFRSANFNLPVNLKEPDLSDFSSMLASQKLANIKDEFDAFESALANNESIEPYIDLDAAARFMLANDIVLGQEIGHPKSAYLWREDITNPDSKFILGPMWDYDWAYGYETKHDYCTENYSASMFASSMYNKAGYRFYSALYNHKEFKKHYYRVWKEFVEKGHIQEVIDFVESYYSYAASSFSNDNSVWYKYYDYASAVTRTQEWLRKRHDYIMANIEKYDITDLIYTLEGDADCNNFLTVHDIAVAADYVQGDIDPTFNLLKADIDGSGRVTIEDVEDIAYQVAAADPVSSLYYYNTPVAQSMLSMDEFELSVEEGVNVPLLMTDIDGSSYKAIQADIKLPVGMLLLDAVAGERVEQHNFLYNQLGEQDYRIVAYADKGCIDAGELLASLSLYTEELIPEDERNILLSNILVVNENGNTEQRLGALNVAFGYSTGLSSVEAVTGVRGGDDIAVTLLTARRVDIYSVDGRKVRSVDAAAGTTHINVPAGIYVVEGKKVLVH